METGPSQLDERSVVAAARAAVLAEKRAGCDLLLAAADWADLHPSDSILTPAERLEWHGEDAVLFGGDGTPDVAETAAGTLGAEIGMNPDQARNLISDALDARDRMPRLWIQVQFGRVRRDTVHRVAYRTRHLSCGQAGDIDRSLSASLPRVTPGQRLDHLIEAQIMRVDRDRLEEQAAAAARDRYVRKGRPDGEGMCDVFIHTTDADAQASMAAITGLAKILKARKDCLPKGVPVRGAGADEGDGKPPDGRDGLDEWRAVAAHLLQINPGLAVQIQLQAQQPDLFDQAAEKLTNLADHGSQSHDRNQDAETAALGEIVTELIKHLDLSRLQPTAFLHVHISEASLDGPFGPADPQARLARVEGLGPLFLDVVRQWLGQACTVKLQPMIDAGDLPAVDRYEFTPAMREAMLAQSPASRFPWSNSLARRNDLDHTDPYRPPERGGPPRQTGLHNGGPLTRREHRHKTFGPIGVRQPQPDTRVWRTRFGRVLIVNPSGTFDLGTGDFAQAVWSAAVRLTDQPSAAEMIVARYLALAA